MIFSSSLHNISREQEYLEGWQRARAQLDNLRKRVDAERQLGLQRARRQAIESMLHLADNMQALTRHVPEHLADDTWAQGVLHVARQIEQTLEQLGAETIFPAGVQFDPAMHEAVEEVEGTTQARGFIVEVLQAGYRIGDTVIRPARVKIAT